MKKYSASMSAFCGEPVYLDQSKLAKAISTAFQSHVWHEDYVPPVRQARYLADENGIATDIPNPDYVAVKR